MKLSREWLSEFTDIEVSDKQYCDAMTMSGSKVEGWEVTGEEISGVLVGRVTEITRHENSDHMWICKMDIGGGKSVTIVTGAQNVSQGDLVPAALDGSTLPGGIVIKDRKMRGVMSQGMLCSLSELGLDKHDYPYAYEDGIFILEEDCSPGDDIKTVLGFGDTVVEFEITNNRPDCLSVIGLARESAATFGRPLMLHTPEVRGGAGEIEGLLSVEIDALELCPRYTAKLVKDIKIEPSPAWLRRRLRVSGVRPINNIVDITNYVMLEYGQPMHAFDYSCVTGGKIIVRRARAGETLETLDGKPRAITPEMLVIADEGSPIAIAGVMGGGNSEITESTTTLVFESANFNGTSIRKTATALGMRTDASGRYEKGLDPALTVPAIERACELIELLGAGVVCDGTIDVGSPLPAARVLKLEPEKINALLGTKIDREFMVETLEKLSFEVVGDEIKVPSFRGDIEGGADIAEEVARLYGYNKIEPTLFGGKAVPGGFSKEQVFSKRISEVCRGLGFNEVLTYSFGSPAAWNKIRLPEDDPKRDAFVILNPLGEDTSVMRTTALPSMLETLATNLNKGNKEVRLFEQATVYRREPREELARESAQLALGAYGGGLDFYGFKGYIESLLGALRIEKLRFEPETENVSYHPGRCAAVLCAGRVLGVLGQLHPEVCNQFGLDYNTFAAQLDVLELLECVSAEPTYKPLPRYPAVIRDIALVSDSELTAAQLEDAMVEAGGKLLESVALFDVYTGGSVPEGKRSLAFTLTLRAPDKTLTDEDADRLVSKVLSKVGKLYGAVLR